MKEKKSQSVNCQPPVVFSETAKATDCPDLNLCWFCISAELTGTFLSPSGEREKKVKATNEEQVIKMNPLGFLSPDL